MTAPANIVWSSVYVYDSSKVRNWNAPKTMADFFNTEAYPGKRGMRKSPKVTMEFALIADGVPTSEVYDVLGTEEGIALPSLSSTPSRTMSSGGKRAHSRHSFWLTVRSSSPPPGTAVCSTLLPPKTRASRWFGTVRSMTSTSGSKGSKNVEAALDFVSFSTATEQLANRLPGSPTARPVHRRFRLSVPTMTTRLSRWPTICQQHLATSPTRCRTTSSSGQTTRTT